MLLEKVDLLKVESPESSFCRGRDKLQQNRVEKGFPSTERSLPSILRWSLDVSFHDLRIPANIKSLVHASSNKLLHFYSKI